MKKSSAIVNDIGSPKSVERFRQLASTFTIKATTSRAAALKTLQREGMITAKGNLTKRYTAG
jgi:hypothetical protein